MTLEEVIQYYKGKTHDQLVREGWETLGRILQYSKGVDLEGLSPVELAAKSYGYFCCTDRKTEDEEYNTFKEIFRVSCSFEEFLSYINSACKPEFINKFVRIGRRYEYLGAAMIDMGVIAAVSNNVLEQVELKYLLDIENAVFKK